jgi:ATP-dependent DNA ligase
MIIEAGGEGVILQKVGSLYEQGRSSDLLKIKVNLQKDHNLYIYYN